MLATILFALAVFVWLGNVLGVVGAGWRRARGDDRGFSCVPLLSILFATTAWFTGPGSLGAWVFAPAILDPATWTLLGALVCALLGKDNAPTGSE